MRKVPLVTVAIPFLNGGNRFIGAIQSIFAQTLDDWELLLIDDGSSDGSQKIAHKINDPRVTVIHDGVNRGLVARLNSIPVLARGKYIARMDADDLASPTRLETQVELMELSPEIDVVDTGAVVLNQNDCPVGTRALDAELIPSIYEAFKWGVVLHPSVMAKREWWKRNKYDPEYVRAEDRELFVRSYSTSVIRHIPQPLYYYFYHGHVRLGAFLKSYCSERLVLRRYGPSLIGKRNTLWLLGRSLMKSFLLMMLSVFGAKQIISRSVSASISDKLVGQTTETIKRIKCQCVPGLGTPANGQ